jgi:hypothetical protein
VFVVAEGGNWILAFAPAAPRTGNFGLVAFARREDVGRVRGWKQQALFAAVADRRYIFYE